MEIATADLQSRSIHALRAPETKRSLSNPFAFLRPESPWDCQSAPMPGAAASATSQC
jgi:hypothetical protein